MTMLHNAYLVIIAALMALLIAQCGQTSDAKKALLAANTDKTTAEINKSLCEATLTAQGDTITKLQAESNQRKAAASSAMATARAEQNRQAQIIEDIRRAPRAGDNCEAIRIKMIEDSMR